MHKALENAILALPSVRAVTHVQLTMDSLIANEEATTEVPMTEVGAVVGPEWKTGTTDYDGMTIEEIKGCLGWSLTARTDVPFFNTHIDPERRLHAHSDPNGWAQALREERLQPLVLKWHQWVGVICVLVRFFKGEPVFLMDDVGLGKTFQAFAVLAFLEFLRSRKERMNQWGGIFGESLASECVCATSTNETDCR